MKSPLCIPEVPPPPSSPQDLERENSQMDLSPNAQISRITSETPATNGFSSEGQVPTTPRLPISGHPGSRPLHQREKSSVSSPEPWPAVQEDYYDIMQPPITKGGLHDPIPNSIKEESGMPESKSGKEPAMKGLVKDVEVPRPPPPSPESREMLKTSQRDYEEDNRITCINSDSATMTPLVEEKEPNQQGENSYLPTENDENVGDVDTIQTCETVADHAEGECSYVKQSQNINMELDHQNRNDDIPSDVNVVSETDNSKSVYQPADEMDSQPTNEISALAGNEIPADTPIGAKAAIDLEETEKDDNDYVVMEEGIIDTDRAQEELREEYEKLEQ